MEIVVVILASLCGLFLGLLVISNLRTRATKPDGLLSIDKRDAEKDYWDFLLLIPPEDAEKKQYLTIEVKVKS